MPINLELWSCNVVGLLHMGLDTAVAHGMQAPHKPFATAAAASCAVLLVCKHALLSRGMHQSTIVP